MTASGSYLSKQKGKGSAKCTVTPTEMVNDAHAIIMHSAGNSMCPHQSLENVKSQRDALF